MIWASQAAKQHETAEPLPELVVELSDLEVRGNAREPILKGVSLQVRRGDRLLITGESGSGKSTVLRALGNIVTPTAGEVILFGQQLSELTRRERKRLIREQVGFVHQAHNLHEGRKVRKNITTSYDTTRSGRPPLRDIAYLAVALGIAGEHGEMLDRRVDTLSGGQKQRVAIARALLPRPNLLLLDEPTASLDPQSDFGKAAVYGVIDRFAAETGATVVMVSHDEVVL
jgi:ABC-type lipoprotein export system ATPase subunit